MRTFKKYKGAGLLALVAVLALALLVAPQPSAQISAGSVRDASGAFIKETTFLASAARTTSGDSGSPLDLAAYDSGAILINVTAVSGTTPTLTVNFENCITSGTTKCGAHTASASITATGFYVIKASNIARYGRIGYVIGGTTPSFTFEVYGAFKPGT